MAADTSVSVRSVAPAPRPLRRVAARLAPLLVPALMVVVLGCRDEADSPTAPAAEPPLASSTATVVSFRQVSAGTFHTCGVTTGGRAYCWGANASGQLGDGTRTTRLTPVVVAGGLQFVLVSAGDQHSCGVTTDDHAYCWGSNGDGELGDGTTTDRVTPVVVAGRLFRQLHAGSAYTCGVNPNGVAFCWGSNRWGQLGSGVSGWTGSSSTPVRVVGGLKWRRVIPAFSHTCGVTTDDRGYCWGINSAGQLGNSIRPGSPRPVPVFGGLSFRQVFAASGFISPSGEDQVPDEAYSCGLTKDDRAYCWGVATPVPAGPAGAPKLVEGRRFRMLNPASFQACGLNPYDAAFCWSYGTEPPTLVPGGHRWLGLTTSLGAHMCGVTTDNRAYCWGENSSGQLGDGTRTSRATPVPVAAAGSS